MTTFKIKRFQENSIINSAKAGLLLRMAVMSLVLLFAFTSCTEEMEPTIPVTEQSFRSVPVNVTLPIARPGFVEGVSRTEGDNTTGTWEMLMELRYTVDDVQYQVYATVLFGGTTNSITVQQDYASIDNVDTDLKLLQYSAEEGFTVNAPYDATTVSEPTGVCYYAPAMEWQADGTLPIDPSLELWKWVNGQWNTQQARLRVAGLTTGHVVTYAYDAGTQTATADADGNAYFYLSPAAIQTDYTVSVNGVEIFKGYYDTEPIIVGKAYVLTLTEEMKLNILIGKYRAMYPTLVQITRSSASDIMDYDYNYGEILLILTGTETVWKDIADKLKNFSSVHLLAAKATEVGDNTFYNCYSLASVHLPAVTSVGINAFEGCSSLTTLTFGTPVNLVGENAFAIETANCDLTLAAGQIDVEGLVPDMINNIWAGKLWKSITLVQASGEY